jgi:heptosyltransferase-3
MTPLYLPRNSRILLVALRRLGDVLLTTPLIRSMRSAWPSAQIDVLVFSGTAGILEGNPDITNIIEIAPGSGMREGLALARRLFRRYALAISTQAGDRPTLFAALAGRIRVALVEDTAKGRMKRGLLDRVVAYQPGVHRVEETLRFADALGIPRVPEIVCPRSQSDAQFLTGGAYAVLHPSPFYRYKAWNREGWRALADALIGRGLNVFVTGGNADEETRQLDMIWQGASPKVRRLDGRLGWGQLASLIRGAQLYVGPDTSVTHLAAASGCKTVALFGPTDPRLWAPFPHGGLEESWTAAAAVQKRGNVWLVQNPLPCVPCQLEGCERNVNSYSVCLDDLAARKVIDTALVALDTRI